MKKKHLDFTTLYGAAQVFENSNKVNSVVKLSNLLNFNQLIEAIVLFDELQYEIGNIELWSTYTDALHKSKLYKLIKELSLPFNAYISDYDKDALAVNSAVNWALDVLPNIPTNLLLNTLIYREKTFSHIHTVSDEENPFLKHHFDTAIEVSGEEIHNRIVESKQYLMAHKLDELAVHSLIRSKLIYDNVVKPGSADYFPHFTRYPIMKITNLVDSLMDKSDLRTWTSKRLSEIHDSLHKKVWKNEDSHAYYFSPYFIACLADANYPEDILSNALILRDAAKDFRRETSILFNNKNIEFIDVEYAHRFASELDKLETTLLPEAVNKKKVSVKFSFTFPLPKLKIDIAMAKDIEGSPKDKSILYISNVLRNALTVISVSNEIERIFDAKLVIDTGIVK